MNPERLCSLGLWEGWGFELTRGLTRRGFHFLLQDWCGLSFSGASSLQNLSQCLLAPTHASHLDFWAVLEGLPSVLRQQTYVAAASDHFYRPGLRRLFTRMGSYHNFAFDRRAVGTDSFRRLLGILEAGFSLLLFPQGTRTRDGGLMPLKPLVSLLAVESGLPVVPIVVQGTFESLPAGRFWPRRHPIQVAYGTPLLPDRGRMSVHAAARNLNQELMERTQMLWRQTHGAEKAKM
jgi:long-chain acyl-CoA synthetase